MAARNKLSALLLFYSTFSSSSSFFALHNKIRQARFLPFCNAWKISANHTNGSTGNPRFFSSAASELTDSDDVLNYLRCENDPQKIREIFNRRVNDPVFGAHFDAYRLATRKLSKAKAFDRVEEILDKLLEESNPPSELTAGRVMRLYGTASMPDHVIRTFERLKDLGLSPSEKCFSTFLAALVDAGSPDKVHEFFSKIQEFGLSPDVYSYTATVKAFCAMNDYNSAIKVLRTMRKKGFEPTEVAYDTIFMSLYTRFKQKEIDEGKLETLLDKLLESCRAEFISYGMRIRRFCKKEKTHEAMVLFKEAESKGLHLTNQTLNSLVLNLCKDKRVIEAKKVLEMIPDSRGRSSHAWNILARGFIDRGDLETAMSLVQEMFDYDRLPNGGTVHSLLNALIKSKKIETDEVRLFIDRLKKKMPPFEMTKWVGNI